QARDQAIFLIDKRQKQMLYIYLVVSKTSRLVLRFVQRFLCFLCEFVCVHSLFSNYFFATEGTEDSEKKALNYYFYLFYCDIILLNLCGYIFSFLNSVSSLWPLWLSVFFCFASIIHHQFLSVVHKALFVFH